MNTPVNYYRYTLTNRFGTYNIAPLGESEFSVKWTREDEQKFSYKKEMPGKATFTGDMFNDLLQLEQSEFRCEYTDITIERKCTNNGPVEWVPWFSGRLSMNDGSWDLDRCLVELKISQINPEQCLEDNKSVEINLLEKVAFKRTIGTLPTGYEIETVEYTRALFDGFTDCTTPYWNGGGTPEAGKWKSYYHSWQNVALTCISVSRWARYKKLVDCADPSPGPEWLLISTACPGVGKTYVKEVQLYDCVERTEGTLLNKYIRECKIVGETTGGTIDNGMDLKDVLEAFAAEFCEDLNVVSNFFQINPDTPSGTNYVTGEDTKVDKLVLFQKSDVKRPDALNNATKANWTFEKCMNAICEAFNCRWRIEGDDLRIEHVSYFSQNAGFDLTLPKYSKYIAGKRKYSYQTEKIPNREEFKWMESGGDDFRGLPISYSGACVSQEGRENVKTHTVDDVTTDVELCFANPDSESNIVDDRGFVLIACRESDGQYLIITEDPILSELGELNNSLSWAHLHRDYHKYYRPLINGNMNGEDTVFESTRPTKKGEVISFPLCCGDDFDPDDTIKTLLGDGIIDNASFSFKNNTLTVELLYPISDLEENDPPVAVNDIVGVVKNVAEDINVLANDTDPDGDPITEVQIIDAPSHGVATVNPDKTVHYIPTTNFTGPDSFTYRIKDNFGNWSNTALVAITVVPPTLTLELVNDVYSTDKNVVLNQPAAGGLLDNDSTTAGPLVCTTGTFSTSQGGSVEIFADGSFDYTPPTDFFGDDTFSYEATNGTDTDTANVTVTVINVGGRHLQLEYYTQGETGAIGGWCMLEGQEVCRTTEATDDAIDAGQTVKVTVRFTNDSGCPPVDVEYIFGPGDTCQNITAIGVCNFPPGCTAIDFAFISIAVV